MSASPTGAAPGSAPGPGAVRAKGAPRLQGVGRLLAEAAAAGLVVAHAQAFYVAGPGVIPAKVLAEHHFVPLPLLRATFVYDVLAMGTLALLAGGLARAGERRLRSPAQRAMHASAAVLASVFAVPAAAALALRTQASGALGEGLVGALGAELCFAAGACGLGAALFAAFVRFAPPRPPGFALALPLLALVLPGSTAALDPSAAAIAFWWLGGTALALAAARVASGLRTRAAAPIAAALALLAAAQWHLLTSLGADRPRALPAPAAAAAPPDAAAPDLVVIVLDTLRADALDRAPGGNTPRLARFAAQARVARRAVSTSSWTLPAHASLFTGSYPTTHGAHFPHEGDDELAAARLAPANQTLAEQLAARGYRTLAVVANFAYLSSDTGIDQGFELWDDRYAWAFEAPAPLCDLFGARALLAPLSRAAALASGLREAELQHRRKLYRLGEDVSRAGLALLDAADARRPRAGRRPLLLFLNYMEAHAPYIPRARTRLRAGDALQPQWLDARDGPGGVDPTGPGGAAVMRGERDLRPDERRHLEAAYAGEVHDLDAALGTLFDGLRARGLYDDAWIVVTADHGEFLGEHRLLGHSSELYQEAIAVPLLVKEPQARRRDPIEGIAQPVDLLPSLAEPFGLSLAPQVEGLAFDDPARLRRPAVAEHYEYDRLVAAFGARFAGHRRALLAWPYKLAWWSARPAALFDLARDPREQRDLAAREPARAGALREALARWVRARRPLAQGAPGAPLSPEERRRLERLGYL